MNKVVRKQGGEYQRTYRKASHQQAVSTARTVGRRRDTGVGLHIRFILVFILCVFLLSCLFVLKSNASQEYETYKYYTSIQIQEGDTLWSIADTYHSNMALSRTDYIQEIIELNHIDADNIHAGNYLIIPYYDTSMKR
jgi:cell division protein YceG involved in septum cleavage